MSDVFVYADETGNLDFDVGDKDGATPYFGFGTATFEADHGAEVWDGHVLRAALEERGFPLPKGFHAKNDLWGIRSEVLALLGDQKPRVDATFLLKARAQPAVRARGQDYLYKLAWYLHLKYLCQYVFPASDHLYVVVATFGTKKRAQMARQAVQDVCNQMRQEITLCVWEASSCWGLQAADYALWAVQRHLSGQRLASYDEYVEPLVKTVFAPWGRA